ncbi:hypothetical protein GMDG_08554, partial [Pseudogymnoascus destructans 20631-21]
MSKKPTSNIPQDNDGQLPRMTTRQTTTAATTSVPSEDIPSRMAHLEAQIQEVKDLLVILSASQTRIPSTPPVDAPIPTVEVTEQRTPRTRNTPETVQLPPLRNTRSPSIPGSSRMHTEDPPNRYKKSTISEKILPLSDGVEHTFLQWSASIRDRLVVNEDHYLTDVSRRALIWGTTTGLAKTYLEPQYLSATHGFRSAEEMMDLLGSYYLTGNEMEQARRLSKALQSPIQKLPYSVPIRGFQCKIQGHVSEYIRLHLTVEGRRIYNCPFVLLDLGAQDVIIGKKLFSCFRILLDSAKSRLVWPKEYPPTPSWSKEITLPYHSRDTSIKHPAYQSDANRRDFAIHCKDRRRAGGRSMEMKVITSDYEEITDTPSNPPRNQEVSPPPQKTLVHRFTPMHICEISANAFHHEMMRNDS